MNTPKYYSRLKGHQGSHTVLQAWAWRRGVCVCARACSERLFWSQGEISMGDVTREAAMELAITEVWDFMHHERWDGC